MNGLFTAGQKKPQAARLIARLLRGPKFSRFLERLGIDPKQYWLLTDLFHTIGQRREFMGQLGRDRDTLRWVTILYGALMGMMSLGLAAEQPTSSLYLLIFLGITAFLLFSIVISETSNTLVNPVEALMLAHQPINGATYTAAKLTHILTIVLYLVPGLNAVPALAGARAFDRSILLRLVRLADSIRAGDAAQIGRSRRGVLADFDVLLFRIWAEARSRRAYSRVVDG
jgi:hypothetical protein